MDHSYKPKPDAGPTLWNLGGFYTVNAADSVTLQRPNRS